MKILRGQEAGAFKLYFRFLHRVSIVALPVLKDCTPPRKHIGNHGFPEAQEETLGQKGYSVCEDAVVGEVPRMLTI